MRKTYAAACFLLALGLAWAASPHPDVLDFRTMVGVAAPYTGTTNPIRGVSGGGAPWAIADAKGELRGDGHLRISVRGLVLVSTGANPLTAFRGLVSCQSVDGAGAPSIVNLSTGDFPATSDGFAEIDEVLALPQPCIAPIVFVTTSTQRWLAATGH
jgi:hypothetical protein